MEKEEKRLIELEYLIYISVLFRLIKTFFDSKLDKVSSPKNTVESECDTPLAHSLQCCLIISFLASHIRNKRKKKYD